MRPRRVAAAHRLSSVRNTAERHRPEPWRHQVWELPEIKPLVTEYRRHRLICRRCGTSTCAPLPEGVPTRQGGPRLVAFNSTRIKHVDKLIARLLRDLKQRGFLNETLVVWGTEFGRTPGAERSDGCDHHPYGFSIWLAGGGIKRGVVHGKTDELGFLAVEDRHYITDLHATVLHQLGLDSRRLEVPGHKRLEIDFGEPIHEIMS